MSLVTRGMGSNGSLVTSGLGFTGSVVATFQLLVRLYDRAARWALRRRTAEATLTGPAMTLRSLDQMPGLTATSSQAEATALQRHVVTSTDPEIRLA